MTKRGGGVIDMKCKIVAVMPKNKEISELVLQSTEGTMLILEFFINVCDSMGANLVNTICEGVSPMVESISGGRVALRVLSNLCIHRRAGALFKLPLSDLKTSQLNGSTVAKRILEAYLFASSDPFRAATHNKGVMNGIDSVAIATGQDWRALNSAIYTNSLAEGVYQPITQYKLEKCLTSGQDFLVGSIEIPISVGVKGGATQSNSLYQQNLRILGNPSSRELSEIIACVGLAQNFAALRALSLEGIQKGHMKLHARNIAISAGVPRELIEKAVNYMQMKGSINTETAREFLIQSNLNFQAL